MTTENCIAYNNAHPTTLRGGAYDWRFFSVGNRAYCDIDGCNEIMGARQTLYIAP